MYFKNIFTYISYFLILSESFSHVFCVENYQDNIHFYLYSRSIPSGEFQEINVTSDHNDFKTSKYDPRIRTKVIIHGYKSGPEEDHFMTMKDNYLSEEDYNVFLVDWKVLADRFYLSAVANARVVGVFLARFIVTLKEEGMDDIHLIGHSLGAHVAAVAAHYLEDQKVSRITGLDPAGPLFDSVGEDAILSAEDAEFVDVYHTNAKIAGKFVTCGHVDFYFNGGKSQPGCGDLNFACYHRRAVHYFAESIISYHGFGAHPCNLEDLSSYKSGKCSSSQPMILAGEYADRESTGTYSVVTNAQSPFVREPFW